MNLKRQLILILGLWVALMPFLGFPPAWRKPIFVLSGLAITYLAYTLVKKPAAAPPKAETFRQNGQPSGNPEQQ